MKYKTLILVILCFLFLIKNPILASLKINEIYPAPASGEKEWVEIYNDEETTIDLTGYFLADLANNKITFESNTITSYGYILGICSNVLNNTGDTVYLKNNIEETIDTVTYSGTFTSDKTYVKCSNDNWNTLTTITKNYSNETACAPTPPPTPSVTSEVTEIVPTPTITLPDSPTPTIINVSYTNIFISEVMVNPPPGEEEWVEIYNNNDFLVYLENWYLDDLENAGSTPKLFSLSVPEKNYAIFELSSSIFNNDGDQVRLLDFNKNLKDSFEYGSSTQGKTWARTDFATDNFCLQEPSKNSVNNSCLNPTAKSSSASPTTSPPTSTTIPTHKSITSTSIPVLLCSPSSFYAQSLKSYASPEVLGTTTKVSHNNSQPLVRSLSFLSLGYSLLTIVSVLVKMKLC